LLARRGFGVVAAGSVAEARDLAGKETFNLLISDIGLPDGDGYSLMNELGQKYGLKGIALTGYGMEEDIARSQAAGFLAHITKPVHIRALETALATAMSASSQNS
jgi:CheY-like chemotaxis protein